MEVKVSSVVNIEDTGVLVVLGESGGLNVDIIEAKVEPCIVDDDVNFVNDEDKEVVEEECIKVDCEVLFNDRAVLLVECTKRIFDCMRMMQSTFSI